MNVDEIIMRASAIKLLNKSHTLEDKQKINDECNRIIAICEAVQQSVQADLLSAQHGQSCACDKCKHKAVYEFKPASR